MKNTSGSQVGAIENQNSADYANLIISCLDSNVQIFSK